MELLATRSSDAHSSVVCVIFPPTLGPSWIVRIILCFNTIFLNLVYNYYGATVSSMYYTVLAAWFSHHRRGVSLRKAKYKLNKLIFKKLAHLFDCQNIKDIYCEILCRITPELLISPIAGWINILRNIAID